MKTAVIELGSNSCKVLLADQKRGIKPLLDKRIPCRIAAFLSPAGELGPEGLKTILETIIQAQKQLQEAEQTFLIGTEALRRIADPQALGKAIKAKTGLDLRVLSAEEEAKMSFLGATAESELKGKIVFFDTGGLSTEVVFAQGSRYKRCKIVNLGAVALAAKYLKKFPMANSCFYGLEDQISSLLKFKSPHNPILIGTGGVVVTCAAVAQAMPDYDPKLLEGFILSRSEVFRQISLYRSMSLDEIKAVPGMDASRADTILAGAMIILRMMDILGVSSLKVTTKGVRFGCLTSLK